MSRFAPPAADASVLKCAHAPVPSGAEPPGHGERTPAYSLVGDCRAPVLAPSGRSTRASPWPSKIRDALCIAQERRHLSRL